METDLSPIQESVQRKMTREEEDYGEIGEESTPGKPTGGKQTMVGSPKKELNFGEV